MGVAFFQCGGAVNPGKGASFRAAGTVWSVVIGTQRFNALNQIDIVKIEYIVACNYIGVVLSNKLGKATQHLEFVQIRPHVRRDRVVRICLHVGRQHG